ncbi:MAG TPA: methyl-accepting chemotaxis protein, partial [Allocoleopsis sp.]
HPSVPHTNGSHQSIGKRPSRSGSTTPNSPQPPSDLPDDLPEAIVPQSNQSAKSKKQRSLVLPKPSRLDRNQGSPLRRQLLTTVLPVALLPLIVGGFSSAGITYWRAEQRASLRLKNEVVLASQVTNKQLKEKLQITELLATNPVVIEAARIGSQQAESAGLQQLSIDQVEQKFAGTKLLKPNATLNSYLSRIGKKAGLPELFFTERHGFNIAASQSTSDFVQRDEAWWQEGKNRGQWLSNPALDKSSNTFSVDLVQAIKDPDSGEFLGVIKGVFDTNELGVTLGDELEHIGLEQGSSEQVQVLDLSSGSIVSTITPQGLNPTQELLGGNEVLQQAKRLEADLKAKDIDPEKFIATRDDLEALTTSFIYQGRRYTLAKIPTVNWVVVASIDIGEIRATGNEQALVFILILVLLGAVATPMILFLARRLSTPLKDLADTADQVAGGDLDVYAQPQGTSETFALAENFNNLVVRVKSLLQKQEAETRRVQLLADITAQIRQSLNLDAILQTTVEAVQKGLETNRVMIYRFDDNWDGVVIAESVAPGWSETRGIKLVDTCLKDNQGGSYRNGQVRAIADIYDAGLTPCHIKMLERFDVKANLVAPILVNEKLFGLLIAHHCSAARDWEQPEIELFAQLSTQVGIALEQAQLLEQIEQARQQAESTSQEQRQQKESLQMQLIGLLSDVEGASRGDLTVRADVTAGDIGTVADFFNAIIESLRRIVTQVKTTAGQVNTSVGENEHAIRQLAEVALKQAEEIAHTLNSVEQMTASIQAVAVSAHQAADVARQASTTAETGGVAMDKTVRSILSLRETVANTAKKVKRLGESSQQISKVVSLINQIALQTNLLAINASIEAARAGEEGRGFAVVAEEVGELAAQSAAATKDIEQIVENIQLETSEVVQAMELGTTQVVEGTHLVEDAKHSLSQILEVSRHIDQLVRSISDATVSQAQTSQSVTQLMQQLAQASQHTSEASRQVSTSLSQTVTVTQQLQESVDTFKVGTEV